MPINKNIKELLNTHGYLVKVRQDDKFDSETAISRCIATFPNSEGGAATKQEKIYEVLLEGGITVDGEQWLCAAYAAREFIRFDIYNEAQRFNIDKSLIVYYDLEGNEVEDLDEVIRITPTGEHELLEMQQGERVFGQKVLQKLFERTAQP